MVYVAPGGRTFVKLAPTHTVVLPWIAQATPVALKTPFSKSLADATKDTAWPEATVVPVAGETSDKLGAMLIN